MAKLAMSSSQAVRCYNYNGVYPPGGEELQLEQVRALLPQYNYASVKSFQHKATEVPCYQKDKVYPPCGGEFQLEQVRAMLPKYQLSCDMELTQITTNHIPPHHSLSKDHSSPSGFEEELNLVQDQENRCCRDQRLVSSPSGFEEELNLLQDKENRCGHSEGNYAFTPNTVESDLGWSHRNGRGDNLVNTKLNFTDTDSVLSMNSQCYVSHQTDSSMFSKQSHVGTCLDKFNVESDLEIKAKLLQSQQGSEEEFALTEITRSIKRPLVLQETSSYEFAVNPSLISSGVNESSACESFTAFHDSMQTSTSFRKPCVRKPLQVLTEASFDPSRASFGPVETTCDESSFIPYHDSMQTSSSFQGPPRAYTVPLGVPIVHSEQALSEQTFTQFDIAHPKEFESVSTPVHHHKDLSMDLSVIPSVDDNKGISSHAPASRPRLLTPIKEEPSGSTTSSRFTVSSSNSSGNSCQSVSATSDHHMECNPFLPDIINRMLNSLGGVPHNAVKVLTDPMPIITPGKGLVLHEHAFHSVTFQAKNRCSQLYLVHGNFGEQVLRVHNAPLEWELTILTELKRRLQKIEHQELHSSFQSFDHVYQFPTTFVTLSAYHCYGSVQNVIDKFYTAKRIIPECLVSYLTLEMLSIIGYLHQSGIIHAALKPAHFLISDVSNSLSSPTSKGLGLRLIDFRQAIDTKQFPDDHMFVCSTPPMYFTAVIAENQPWKWQMDYCGLAVCIMPLITNGAGPPMIVKKENSALYTLCKKPCKKYNTSEWQNLIDKLLNAAEPLSLHQLGQFLEEKTKGHAKEIIRLLYHS